MRNGYLAAMSTYARPALFWNGIAGGFLLTVAFLLALGQGASPTPDDGALFPFYFAIPFLFGMTLVEHLKQMLGNARSRVIPGLHRCHFTIAGLFTAFFAIFIPCMLSFVAFGSHGPHLAMVAFGLGLFVIAFFLNLWSVSRALLWIVFFAFPILRFESRAMRHWWPSTTESLLLIAASMASVVALAMRYSRFNEEMSGFGEPTSLDRAERPRRDRSTTRDAAEVFFGVTFPFLGNLRSLGGASPGPGEGLWRRARHWDAAWRVGCGTVLIGVGVGAFLAAFSPDRTIFVYGYALPLLAMTTCTRVLQSPSRNTLANEFLRPFSRKQHVHSVALVLALSGFMSAVGMIAVPLFAGLRFDRNAIWCLLVPLAWTPLVFAFAAWNAHSVRVLGLFLGYLAYSVFLLVVFVGFGVDQMSDAVLSVLCGLVLIAGLAVTRGAYRSWLNEDVG